MDRPGSTIAPRSGPGIDRGETDHAGIERAQPAPRMAIPLGRGSDSHVEQAQLTFDTDAIDAGKLVAAAVCLLAGRRPARFESGP